MCRPAPPPNPGGRRNGRRYHQECRDSASGTCRLLKPATGSGKCPCSTRLASTVPGTVALTHPAVLALPVDRMLPSVVSAQESSVSAQPDSIGTVPSGAGLSAGGGAGLLLPQLLHPVAGACRSTVIHCGSGPPARHPVPRTPASASRSTANSAGVGP